MSLTAFGPQGPNFSTVRPSPDPQLSGGQDTWFVNCSAAGVADGTYQTADFFNVIVANLRRAVAGVLGNAGLTGEDDMLLNAILAAAAKPVATATTLGVVKVGAGLTALPDGTIALTSALPTALTA